MIETSTTVLSGVRVGIAVDSPQASRSATEAGRGLGTNSPTIRPA
jgi:hypothetical protein